MENLVCYKAHRGALKGFVLVYQYVDSLFGDEVQALIQQLQKEGYQEVQAATYDEYELIAEKALIETLKVNQPQVISLQTFNEKFNILPPQGYFKSHDFECFRMSEAHDLTYYSYFAKIGTRCFEVVANSLKTNADAVFKLCQAHIESELSDVAA